MEDILCMFMVSVFLVTIKGQCPMNVGYKSITTCDDTSAFGPLIYIDFYKINRPCLCTVASTLSGNLRVTAQEIRISSCSTQVVVNGSRVFGCPLSRGTSVTFTLLQYQLLSVQAEFTQPSSSGTFYQCIGFQQNGGKGGDVSVLCEIPTGATTRRSYTESLTGKTTSPVTPTARKKTSTVASILTTRTTTSPLTVPTGKTTSPVTSTRKITCPLSATTSKIKLTSTANTTTNKQSTPLSSYIVQSTMSTSRFYH